jgi:hypothetical protein
MRALDLVNHKQEMMNYIEKLMSIDPMRSNYYADLREYKALTMLMLRLKNPS